MGARTRYGPMSNPAWRVKGFCAEYQTPGPRDGLLDLRPLKAALLASNVAPAALRLPRRREAIPTIEAAGPIPARTRPPARTIFSGVHAERSPAELISVEALDRLLGVLLGFELYKRKAARPPAFAVGRQKYISNRADLGKKSLNLVTGRFEIEVSDEHLRRHSYPTFCHARRATGRKNCAVKVNTFLSGTSVTYG